MYYTTRRLKCVTLGGNISIHDDSIALVICTRNRPDYISGLLDNLNSLNSLPGRILVVDSSDNDTTSNVILAKNFTWMSRLSHLKSSPGLPHQRNVGIRKIMADPTLDQVEVISFTDDDCRLSDSYFESLSKWVRNGPDFCAITGLLDPPMKRNVSIWRTLFYLDSKKSGAVLKSGYTTPVDVTFGNKKVEWIPGGSMNIKKSALKIFEFDSNLRMYGEDLKMSLMIRKLGPLYVDSDMTYQHLEAKSGKDKLEDIIAFSDGIRWQLAKEFNQSIKRRYILWSIFGSIIASGLNLFRFDRHNASPKSILFGHLIFLYRVLLKKSYTQKVG